MKQRNQTKLASICGVSRQTLALWQARHDWPGDGATEATLKRYAAASLARTKKNQAGPHADLKRAKLEKQIRLLTAQANRAETESESAALRLAAERAQVVPLAEFKAHMLEMQNVCLRLWEAWIEAIGSKRKDAALMEEMRKGRDQVLAELVAVIDSAEPTEKA